MELEEVINLLKENEFSYVDMEEDPSIINDYYTLGQLMYHVREPLDVIVMYEALQGMGIIGNYEGYQIPNNIDYTVFTIEKDDEGNDKILILYKKTFVEEFESMLNENEHFIENMKKENLRQKELLENSPKIVSIAIDTIGGSFKKNKIIAISMVMYENNRQQEKTLWVDNNWNQDDIDVYTTPKYEGKKSSFEYLNLPLPGMYGSENNPFVSIKDVLRGVYGYTKGACLIIEQKTPMTMIKKLFTDSGVNESHHMEEIITGYVEVSRISKEQKGDYFNLKELMSEYKVDIESNYYSSGTALKLIEIAKKMKLQIKR